MNSPYSTILMFTLGVSAMFGFYWLCMRFLVQPQSKERQWTSSRLSAVSLLVLYLPGLLLLWLFIKDLPSVPLPVVVFVPGDYLVIFLAHSVDGVGDSPRKQGAWENSFFAGRKAAVSERV